MYLGGSENPYFPIILVGLGICELIFKLEHILNTFVRNISPGCRLLFKGQLPWQETYNENVFQVFSVECFCILLDRYIKERQNLKNLISKFSVFIGNFILLGLYNNNYLQFRCHTHPPLTKNEPCRIYESLFYVLFGKV